MAKRTVWIIQEINWQYNDEIYYRSDDGDAGIPKIVYTTKPQAYAECERLNQIERDKKHEMYCSYESEKVVEDFFEVVEVELGG